MNKLFSTLFSTLRAKFTSLWTRLRLFTSLTYWQTTVVSKLRQWFSQLFNVKPRHKKDYYSLARWLVSKRLAFAAVVILGVLGLCYIASVLPAQTAGKGGVSMRTYRYNAIPLKFYSGAVRILAADGHLAYVGQVKDAHCVGKGTLYDKEEDLVYEGDFADSMFNGKGNSYYKDGTLQYQGDFSDNLYHGVGNYYRPSGIVEYKGDHVAGHRTGQGELFNSTGKQIFAGSFQKDQIVYGEFLDKDTSAVAQMYSGQSAVYTAGTEYCVSMPEINAVYSIDDGANALEDGWKVNRVLVLDNQLQIEGKSLNSINQITSAFGQPDYFGTAWVELDEAVAINLLADQNSDLLGRVNIGLSANFDDVYTVNEYDKNFELYIYTYVRDGLLYTFYCTGAGIDTFVLYAIEKA